MEHIVYTSRDYGRPSPFLKKFLRQSQPSTSEPEPKKGRKEFKYGVNVTVSYWLMIWTTYSIFKSFYSISLYSQPVKYIQLTQNHHDLLSLQRQNPVDSLFWSRLCYYCSKSSRPKYNNRLTRNTPSCLAIALVSKTRFLNNHSARVPITSNQEGTMEMRDEVLSSVGAQDLDTSSYQVSNLEDIEVNWENSQLELDAVFRPGIDTPLFSNYIWRFIVGWWISSKPHCVGWRGRRGECSSSNNTRLCQTHQTAQAAEKSSFWSKNGKCTRL